VIHRLRSAHSRTVIGSRGCQCCIADRGIVGSGSAAHRRLGLVLRRGLVAVLDIGTNTG